MIAPSEPRSRAASSATCWSSSPVSRIAVIRAAISRRRLLGLGPAADIALRAVQLLDQPGVRDRDRGLGRERADDAGVVGVEGVRLERVDLERAERARLAGDRGDDHRAEAGHVEEPVVHVRRAGSARRGRRSRVIIRFSATATPVAPTPTGIVMPAISSGVNRLGHARVERPAEDVAVRLDEVEDRAVGADEPLRRVDDLLEQRARVADRGDLGRDLAERLLGVRPPGQLGRRPVELLDQAGVLDRDRRLVGEALEELGLVVVVVVGQLAADRDRAERSGLAAERGGQDGPEAGRLDERVGARRRARSGRRPGSRRSGRPRRSRRSARRSPRRPGTRRRSPVVPGPDGVLARGERPAQGRPVVVEHVDPGGRRFEQPAGLVDGLLEDRVGDRAAPRCWPRSRGPPARRRRAARSRLLRAAELVDQARVLDRDDDLVGERRHQRRVLVVVGVRPGRRDLQDAEQRRTPTSAAWRGRT